MDSVMPLLCHSVENKLTNIKLLSASKCSEWLYRKYTHIIYVWGDGG